MISSATILLSRSTASRHQGDPAMLTAGRAPVGVAAQAGAAAGAGGTGACAGGGVQQIALAGDRIGVLTTGGTALVKEGG
ncbi:hypothetical protein, partial [Actinoplanes sp. NPDC026670]|uniref:hypothetical protein n=1 Tax=Actinoplanes sp. NPDC026670 TaxID=3154700 RepID=UPI0033C2563F